MEAMRNHTTRTEEKNGIPHTNGNANRVTDYIHKCCETNILTATIVYDNMQSASKALNTQLRQMFKYLNLSPFSPALGKC